MSTPRIEQVALAREAGVDDRLDHRHRDAHRRTRLHRLEHVFAEAGLAGRDLQLGLAGDAIDGLVEGEQHALVGGVHADEHGDAEHDAGGREQRAQHVLAEVRPADEAQQDHRRDVLRRCGRRAARWCARSFRRRSCRA